MSNNNVETIGFRKENYPKVLTIANELAGMEDRSPHDSIRKLILEAGREKIDKLRSENPTPKDKDTDSLPDSQ